VTFLLSDSLLGEVIRRERAAGAGRIVVFPRPVKRFYLDILCLRQLPRTLVATLSMPRRSKTCGAPLLYMNCYSLPSDTESDLLRHLVLAFGNCRWHIHGRPTARCARGDGVWHSAEPFCHQLAPPQTFTSRGFVLAPNRSGAASRRQPTKAGIWSWCAGSAGQGLSNFQIGISLHGTSSRGSCRWEDETEECGPTRAT